MMLRRTSTLGLATNVSSSNRLLRPHRSARTSYAARVSGVACSILKLGTPPGNDNPTCAQYRAFTAPDLRESVPDSSTPSRYSFTGRGPNAEMQGSTNARLALG